jgi:hypothetical protein
MARVRGLVEQGLSIIPVPSFLVSVSTVLCLVLCTSLRTAVSHVPRAVCALVHVAFGRFASIMIVCMLSARTPSTLRAATPAMP